MTTLPGLHQINSKDNEQRKVLLRVVERLDRLTLIYTHTHTHTFAGNEALLLIITVC